MREISQDEQIRKAWPEGRSHTDTASFEYLAQEAFQMNEQCVATKGPFPVVYAGGKLVGTRTSMAISSWYRDTDMGNFIKILPSYSPVMASVPSGNVSIFDALQSQKIVCQRAAISPGLSQWQFCLRMRLFRKFIYLING